MPRRPTPRRHGPYHEASKHRSLLERHVDEVYERHLKKQARRRQQEYHADLPPARPPLVFEPYITQELYEALSEHLPTPVAEDDALRAAVVFLRLFAHTDPRGEGLVFGEAAAALVKGNANLAMHHKTGVRSMLYALEEHLGADITDYVPGRYCSQVKALPLPPKLEAVFESERERQAKTPLKDRVNVRTGTRLGRATAKTERRRVQEAANATVRADAPKRVKELLGRLNALPPNRFSKYMRRLKDALIGPGDDLPASVAAYRKDTPARTSALNILTRAGRVRAPLYQMTKKTLRLSPYGATVAALPGTLRQHMFEGCLEIDADSIQLALAGALWDLETVQAILRESLGGGPSWWDILVGHLLNAFPTNVYDGEPASFKALKGICKGFTYAMMFGMSRRNLRRLALEAGDGFCAAAEAACTILGAETPTDIGTVLLQHPAVREIIQARQQRFRAIKAEGGIEDVFGRWIQLTPAEGSEPPEEAATREVQSVLAEAMQSMEMKAMLPVGEAALESPSMYMYLWQHDGITVRPKKSDRPSRYQAVVDILNEAFQKGLEGMQERLGCGPIYTKLSVDAGAHLLKGTQETHRGGGGVRRGVIRAPRHKPSVAANG